MGDGVLTEIGVDGASTEAPLDGVYASTGAQYSIPSGRGRTVRDAAGNALVGATIQVYLAGTTTLATIYSFYGSATPVTSVATDANGKFPGVFVDHDDYPLGTMFKFVTT